MWSAQRSGQGHRLLPDSSVMREGLKLVMVLFLFVNGGFTIIYFTVTNTVVVTDTVTPNALLTVSASLCGIARKITFASK